VAGQGVCAAAVRESGAFFGRRREGQPIRAGLWETDRESFRCGLGLHFFRSRVLYSDRPKRGQTKTMAWIEGLPEDGRSGIGHGRGDGLPPRRDSGPGTAPPALPRNGNDPAGRIIPSNAIA
jgi:hypothetical protein